MQFTRHKNLFSIYFILIFFLFSLHGLLISFLNLKLNYKIRTLPRRTYYFLEPTYELTIFDKTIELYSTNRVCGKGKKYKGKKIGYWEYFLPNGLIYEKGFYHNGKKQGKWLIYDYYESGIQTTTVHYKDDLYNGLYITILENGQLLELSYYKSGNKNGIEKLWNKKGKLIFLNHWRNGEKYIP